MNDNKSKYAGYVDRFKKMASARASQAWDAVMGDPIKRKKKKKGPPPKTMPRAMQLKEILRGIDED